MVGYQHHMHREDLKLRRKHERRALFERQRIVSDDLHPLVDKILCGIHSGTGRVVTFVFHGVALEKMASSSPYEYRISSPQTFALFVRSIPYVPHCNLNLLSLRTS